MPQIIEANAASIAQAASMLRDGKLVAFPTETVYGLGGDATNDHAVAGIYAAKGRPQFNPLIIHVADIAALDELVIRNDSAHALAQQFWPGPLTMVLPRKPDAVISHLASAGLATLAVRIPAHPVALELLRAVKKPIAAPSANTSGRLSPTTPLHVAESLSDKVDMILAAGRTRVGVESTVIDLSQATPILLRPGGIAKEQIEMVIGTLAEPLSSSPDQPASPGMLAAHYAPKAPLRMNADHVGDDEALLAFGPDFAMRGGVTRLNLSAEGDLQEAAANLFAMLHQLDKSGAKGIAVMPIPETGLGLAINDRLRRACAATQS